MKAVKATNKVRGIVAPLPEKRKTKNTLLSERTATATINKNPVLSGFSFKFVALQLFNETEELPKGDTK
jgi:hypothetical protein